MKAPARDAAAEMCQGCAAARVRMLNRAMTAIYDEAVGRHGITIGQLSMLALTLVAEYSTAADLERLLLMERSTISRNLKRMRAQGWVANIPGERPRTHAIVATPKGRRLLERALPDWRAAQETARDLLGGAVVDEVRRVVDALPRAVEARRRLPAGRGASRKRL